MHIYAAHGMWQLFHMIPLLLGNRFSRCDEHYHCFMLLQEITAILCCDVMTEDQPSYLRVLIAQYLEDMVRLYPSRTLAPKFHYLLHCPTLMKRCIFVCYLCGSHADTLQSSFFCESFAKVITETGTGTNIKCMYYTHTHTHTHTHIWSPHRHHLTGLRWEVNHFCL